MQTWMASLLSSYKMLMMTLLLMEVLWCVCVVPTCVPIVAHHRDVGDNPIGHNFTSKSCKSRWWYYGRAYRVKLTYKRKFISSALVLQFAKSKLQAVEMMKKISEHVTDHCVVERIVPYLVRLTNDLWVFKGFSQSEPSRAVKCLFATNIKAYLFIIFQPHQRYLETHCYNALLPFGDNPDTHEVTIW